MPPEALARNEGEGSTKSHEMARTKLRVVSCSFVDRIFDMLMLFNQLGSRHETKHFITFRTSSLTDRRIYKRATSNSVSVA
jgi:hypothetical protein